VKVIFSEICISNKSIEETISGFELAGNTRKTGPNVSIHQKAVST